MTAELASIEIQREPSIFGDNLRVYDTVIDGKVVGYVRSGESRLFEVAPGVHEVYLKIDWGRSEKFEVHLAVGQTVKFRCVPRSNPISVFYWITLGRHRYIRLTQVTGDGTGVKEEGSSPTS